MDRIALRTIIDGMNELQKECKKHETCRTCFFYNSNVQYYDCQIKNYIDENCEDIGKNLSLHYAK